MKSALIDLTDLDGFVSRDTFQRMPIDSEGPAEVIIGNMIKTLWDLLQKSREMNLEVIGIGVSVPGPFDFENGISLMKQKLSSIYGVDLRQEFIRRLQLKKDFKIHFEGDSFAFLIGEAWLGVAKGYDRVIGLTLGTGLGSAFMVEGRIVKEGAGVPPHSAVGWLPYKDGIVEDKISHCGIIARYKELAGKEYLEDFDVKEIASRAIKKGDNNGLQVFEEFGFTLGEILKPMVCDFSADCLVFGGQISRSFSLFEEPLKKQLQSVPGLKKIGRAHLIDLSPLYGVAKFYNNNVAKEVTKR